MDFANVQSWLIHQFGPVLDLAYTPDERGERITIGWTFDLPEEMPVDGPRTQFEIVAIPMLPDPETGDLVSAFDWQAREKGRFEEMVADGHIDKLTLVEAPQEPWRPPED